MVRLTDFALATLLALPFACAAQECKPTLVHMLMFERGSAEIRGEHVAAFAKWIDKADAGYPRYALVVVEGTALKTDRASKVLAEERATKAAEMTRTFLRSEVRMEVSSDVFNADEVSRQGDYAAVQLVPEAGALIGNCAGTSPHANSE